MSPSIFLSNISYNELGGETIGHIFTNRFKYCNTSMRA